MSSTEPEVTFTSVSDASDAADAVSTTLPQEGASGRLGSIQIHFVVVGVLAFVCLVLGAANLLIHYLTRGRKGSWRFRSAAETRVRRRGAGPRAAQAERARREGGGGAGGHAPRVTGTQMLFSKQDKKASSS